MGGSCAAQRDSLNVAKTRRIQAKLGRLFPQLESCAAFAWSGSFAAGDPYHIVAAIQKHSFFDATLFRSRAGPSIHR